MRGREMRCVGGRWRAQNDQFFPLHPMMNYNISLFQSRNILKDKPLLLVKIYSLDFHFNSVPNK